MCMHADLCILYMFPVRRKMENDINTGTILVPTTSSRGSQEPSRMSKYNTINYTVGLFAFIDLLFYMQLYL